MRLALPSHIKFLAAIYLTGMGLFSFLRFILFFQHLPEARAVPAATMTYAFVMGLRFDTVINGYILVLPFLLLTFAALLPRLRRLATPPVIVLLLTGYFAALFAGVSDIPYYDYHNTRLTVDAFQWTDTPDFMTAMILQDPAYYPYMALVVLLFAVFAYSLFRWKKKFLDAPAVAGTRDRDSYKAGLWRVGLTSLAFAVLLFVGIRGRLDAKSPIRWGTAFFSNYAFPNQLGLNPSYTLLKSWLDSRKSASRPLRLADDDEALAFVKASLGADSSGAFASPIARKISSDSAPESLNVVLVLMENMASWKMGAFGNPDALTPHLDSLSQQYSILFTNFYSAGIHTFNGIYSSLFGFPALLNKHPMKALESMQPFGGIGATLSSCGYQTIFFTTHDDQFDNMGGFLGANGYDQIVSQRDYPGEEVLSPLGVPDGYMFDFSLPYLEKMAAQQRPFFAVFLTASDHGPYVIPENSRFVPRSSAIEKQIIEYADWSIGQFIDSVKKTSWYENTLFVFVADHGSNHSPVYDLSLPYHHVPLIMHSPRLFASAARHSAIGGQYDVFPTIMGLLNQPYVNNTLGIDLMKACRPYIFFNADNKLGCLDETWLWVRRPEGGESLYRYVEKDLTDYSIQRPEVAAAMRQYATSMLQATQWLILNKQVGSIALNEN